MTAPRDTRQTLISRLVVDRTDVRDFFDRAAADYRDCHGPAARQLRYRLHILSELLLKSHGGVLVEVGCGTAMHLFALADRFDRAIGLDLSPAMIRHCEAERRNHPQSERIHFAVDAAEELQTLADDSVDALFGVGVFEHVLDRPRAVAQILRVLKPGGVFACLTPNGGYLWYTRIAPWFGLETRHLSTDRFLTAPEWSALLAGEGFGQVSFRPWTFIPRGDMPPAAARALGLCDNIGRLCRWNGLRGGLAIRASRPRG